MKSSTKKTSIIQNRAFITYLILALLLTITGKVAIENGIPEGLWEYWYENGSKKLDLYFENGIKTRKVKTEKENIQKQLECYKDILLPLIYDNITWTSHNNPPIPPIPIEAIQNPTKEDTLRFNKQQKRYKEEKEAFKKKVGVYISDTLYAVDELNLTKSDTCHTLLPKLQSINFKNELDFQVMLNNTNYEYLPYETADLKIKLGRIYFNEFYNRGNLIVQSEDMLGLINTTCYSVVLKSKKWKIE